MKKETKNKSVIVTGASKGIGKYIVEQLLSSGYFVYGCARSNIDLNHKNYLHHQVDITNEREIVDMFKSIRNDSNPPLYGMINNAGIASMNHCMLMPSKTVKNIFEVNFNGTFICSREASKIMKNYKVGRIINFSTIAVPMFLDGESVYAASKSAIETFSKSFAKEVSRFGITVNIIGPNPIKTDLIKNVKNEKLENIIQQQTIKRFGTFEDIMNVVNFYLDKNSDMITGQKIYLGGL